VSGLSSFATISHVTHHPRSATGSTGGAIADPNTGRSRRRLAFWSTGAAILIVALLAMAYWRFQGPGRQGGEPGSVVVELRGTGNATSKPFIARTGWRIEWENTGSYFSFTIHGDVEFGQVIAQNGPGSGITSPVPTGNFSIEVVAQGPWSVTVIQGD
jgi:hypothetical protein